MDQDDTFYTFVPMFLQPYIFSFSNSLLNAQLHSEHYTTGIKTTFS